MKRIIIAEDDQDIWELIKVVLEDESWNIEFFESGDRALEACRVSAPDLLITDYVMPGMNGISLCNKIKTELASSFIPVLLMTSETEVLGEATGLNQGADDYVAKPFGADELKARVNSLLRIKSLVDELKETREKLEEEERKVLALGVVGGAAHQLGQPLTSLTLLCEALADQKLLDSETSEEITSISREISDILEQMKNACDISPEVYIDGFTVTNPKS